MNKGFLASLLVVATVAAGCSTSGGKSSTSAESNRRETTTTEVPDVTLAPTTTTLSPRTGLSTSQVEDAFESALASQGIFLPAEAGYAVCRAIDSFGYVNDDVLLQVGQAIAEAGFSYRDSGFIAGASIAAFCPQYGF